jgi:hypothetical protein
MVILRFQSRSHQAVERVLLRINYDPDVSRPSDQITRTWASHAFKSFVARINLKRTCIRILKSRTRVNLMNDVRAIPPAALQRLLLQGCVDDRAPFLHAQQSRVRIGLVNWSHNLCPCGCTRDPGYARHPQASHFQNGNKAGGPTPVKSRSHLAHPHVITATFGEKGSPLSRKHPGLVRAIGLALERTWPVGQSLRALKYRCSLAGFEERDKKFSQGNPADARCEASTLSWFPLRRTAGEPS